MVDIRGRIVAPDGAEKNRREILVEDESDYDRLPLALEKDGRPLALKAMDGSSRLRLDNVYTGCSARYSRVNPTGLLSGPFPCAVSEEIPFPGRAHALGRERSTHHH